MNKKIALIYLPKKKWWHRQEYLLGEDVEIQGNFIPKGFKTDGATIPFYFFIIGLFLLVCSYWIDSIWLFPPVFLVGNLFIFARTFFPPIGKYFSAAIIHDYLIKKGENRRLANLIFKKELEHLKIKKWRIWCMYKAVSLFTLLIFKKQKK